MSDSLKSISCKSCGGALQIRPNATSIKCEFCGTMFFFEKQHREHQTKEEETSLIDDIPEIDLSIDTCPKCGFSYGWDGSTCSFCSNLQKDNNTSKKQEEETHVDNSHDQKVVIPRTFWISMLILLGLFVVWLLFGMPGIFILLIAGLSIGVIVWCVKNQ